MHVTVVNHALGKRVSIELDAGSTLEELLVVAEVEMGEAFPPGQTAALAGDTSGKSFVADKPLVLQGLTDGATVNIIPASNTFSEFGGQAPVASQSSSSVIDPAEQIRRLFANSSGSGGAPSQHRQPQRQTHVQQQRHLPLDPMDPDYQKKLYERIQEENMLANLEQAMEHTPEAFGRVEMLYVKAAVNKEPLTAFVDSGAQMTIMNEATAERCGILRLLDRRAAGMAKGVGTAEILGRIHMAMVELGGIHVPMSITVLKSQSMEFLIGLDQLKRHQMSIDLKRNVLQVGEDVALPFLSEGELPKHMRTHHNEAEENDDDAQKAIKESLKDAGARASSTAAAEADNDAPIASTTTTTAAPSGPKLTASQEASVETVMSATGQPREIAINALEAVGWDANAAVSILL